MTFDYFSSLLNYFWWLALDVVNSLSLAQWQKYEVPGIELINNNSVVELVNHYNTRGVRRNLTDFLSSQNVAQGLFKVESYAQIETHVRTDKKKKILGSVGIPLLGRLRCQAMNSAL